MNQEVINKIRQLQRDEGNSPCFRMGQAYCKWQQECCWAGICLSEFKVKAVHTLTVVE